MRPSTRQDVKTDGEDINDPVKPTGLSLRPESNKHVTISRVYTRTISDTEPAARGVGSAS